MLHNRKNAIPDPDIHKVEAVFDPAALSEICVLDEGDFGHTFGLSRTRIKKARPGANYYYHRDNGSNVLAVAHLDTVVYPDERDAQIVQTEGGLIIHSGALDDRLGAYVILDMLPKLGMTYDLLLTIGEESGCSTAEHFTTDKQYDWIIEFDRGGTDVVMYDYQNDEITDLVKDCGAKVGRGIFSDICYLEHLGVKGFNWGVGYQDYHSTRGYAWLEDTFSMVAKYARFHQANKGTFMPHYPEPKSFGGFLGGGFSGGRLSWLEDVDAPDVADMEASPEAFMEAVLEAADVSEFPETKAELEERYSAYFEQSG